jgi:hypothetical protein
MSGHARSSPSGGGGFSMEAGNRVLDDYVARVTGAEPAQGVLPAVGVGRRRPLRRALLPAVPRAAASRRTSRCSGATAAAWTATSRAHLLSQDLIYVGGGSVTLACSACGGRTGIDDVLREAWRGRRRCAG